MLSYVKGKRILIIGGTGTIGRELVNKLLPFEPAVIRIYSRDEYKQFVMQDHYSQHERLRFLIGDVRDYPRLERAMNGIDIVFHLAALKHVPSSEYNPFEAVKTNVIGTQNVVEAAIENNVERVLFTSSDKSIAPTHAYGATKLLAERLVTAAEYYRGASRTIFASVRFGNVMGSRGSVIPFFMEQIRTKGKITVTDLTKTRFMMTLDQAVSLTLRAALIAQGGETMILKMPVICLGDLVEVMIEQLLEANRIQIRPDVDIIGLRPGEKMYEELMTQEESRYAYDVGDMFIIPPIFSEKEYKIDNAERAQQKEYSSHEETPLTVDQLRRLILQNNILASIYDGR